MKYLGLVLLLMATSSLAETIKLATEPNVSFETVSKELEPIIDYLNSKNHQSYLVPTISKNSFLEKCQKNEINLVYAGAGYAMLLIKHFGFIPLLTSLEGTQLALISKKGKGYQTLKNNPNTSIYYVEYDLYSQFLAKSLNTSAKLVGFKNTERVIFSVLKNKNSLGVAFAEDLDLAMKPLRKTLSMHESIEFGKIYLIADAKLINKAPDLQSQLLAFHENWLDPKHKFNYLNYFQFKLWQNSDQEGMHVSDEFQNFLNTIKVK